MTRLRYQLIIRYREPFVSTPGAQGTTVDEHLWATTPTNCQLILARSGSPAFLIHGIVEASKLSLREQTTLVL
jgi:hypothetical protein